MKRSFLFFASGAILIAVFTAGCSKPAAETASIDPANLKLYKALPESVPPKEGDITEDKVALGRMLYYDARFSKSQKISCNTCHNLSTYGVDNEPTSTGHKGQKGDRNSPTVYNAAGHFVQFWDGRAKDVEEQAKGPVLNPVEMAMPSEKVVLAVVNSIPEYVTAFKKAFPADKDPVTYDNFGLAIGAFERKLLTPSRWDKFLNGDQNALTAAEKAGFNTFNSAGCGTCHAGAYLGGNLFQKLGAVKDWPDASDPGRAKVTKSDADKMMFKVPSLRNIEKTAPYFHDGKIATLSEACSKMAEYQLGKTLAPEQAASIETFLKALTGDLPADLIKPPDLPKSTPKTPKPSETD
jgi:cytochrome c peroxidase